MFLISVLSYTRKTANALHHSFSSKKSLHSITFPININTRVDVWRGMMNYSRKDRNDFVRLFMYGLITPQRYIFCQTINIIRESSKLQSSVGQSINFPLILITGWPYAYLFGTYHMVPISLLGYRHFSALLLE